MEGVANTLHTTSEHGVSSIATADAHTSAASSRQNDTPADLNGLVRYAERRNLVSARVPSHFKLSLRLVNHHWPTVKAAKANEVGSERMQLTCTAWVGSLDTP